MTSVSVGSRNKAPRPASVPPAIVLAAINYVAATSRWRRRPKQLRCTAKRIGRLDEARIRKRLDEARIEHRDLDMAIAALAEQAAPDQLGLARIKKRKLRLRDEIAALEDELVPDIIA